MSYGLPTHPSNPTSEAALPFLTPQLSLLHQKGGDKLLSVAPFEVVDHGSKLAVRA
ncbi:TPA: hypothetical protein ACH3X1_000533 [Trebouxia sp. C0004]